MNELTNEDRIRDRAYSLWDRAGRPEGHDKEFWRQAERQLGDEGALDVSAEDADRPLIPPLPAGFAGH